ncbi:MAG: LTA synthase family protein [Ruminiclostridium sp.]|nr:LTA synthase family protein [Ruminiclostridium sp.]
MTKRAWLEKLTQNSFAFAVVWSLVLNLIIETLGRFSTAGLWGGIQFAIDKPLVFCYNALLIFATLLIASVFKRRVFTFIIISLFWLAIGIINGVILTQRMTPFTVKDLSNVKDGATIVTNYLAPWHMVLIALAALAAIAGMVWLFVKGPRKEHVKRKRNLAVVVLVFLLCLTSTSFMIRIGQVQTFFGNLAYAYRDYGVVYCFINTWLNTGISKPANYSQEMIQNIFKPEELTEDGTIPLTQQDVDEEYPNVLFLQLESFIDPEEVTSIQLSQDAVPTFRRLKEEYSSGDLIVPACGAGTANVEFEVLTGLSVKFFGPGEYPYKSVLKDQPAESLAFDMKSLGFGTHAIHNHRAVFYNRNTVFANIGFDTYTSVEYMNYVRRTPKDWAKDKVLINCITDALASTEERDMIYTISVQGHGKYPSKEVLTDPVIQVTDAPTKDLKWRWEYYVNQLYEMDQFLAELTETLSAWEEPVVLVLYGDHIPAIDLTEEDLVSRNMYKTEYVIWTNFDMEKKDMDLHTYQLTAHLMERIDMEVGTTFTYQLNHSHSETYLTDLKSLGYDMLYGECYIYGGENPFTPTDLQMGVNEIKANCIVNIAGKYYIMGENFTPYSKVTLKGKELETNYMGERMLELLEDVDPEEAKNLKVSQIETKSNEILSTTE